MTKETKMEGVLFDADDPTKPPKSLRLMKAITDRPDGSSYLIPLPSLQSAGLHFSLHPGEIHLRTNNPPLTARIDLADLIASVTDGRLDTALARMMTFPASGHRCLLTVVQKPPIQKGGLSEGDFTLDMAAIAAASRRYELEDSGGLVEAVRWLRRYDGANQDDLILVEIEDTGAVGAIHSAGPPEGMELPVPQVGVPPFPKTMDRIRETLRSCGAFYLGSPGRDEYESFIKGLPGFSRFWPEFEAMMKALDAEAGRDKVEAAVSDMIGGMIPELMRLGSEPPKKLDPAPKPDPVERSG
jgi:hypothetical protein